jgi:DNA polymerase III subunit gamma/tau
MAYQVLARKWRPQNFSQIVGQEHVVQSLIHALQNDRLHHAYLFTGTRGVGKTTVARILAKAINCENLKDSNPCGECSVCQDFASGRFMDLIEVDAASRTKVEDTRDLLDNAQYAPNQGRYKVYLIDEVHMLSGHSFNALLKTLEEPPPHVKFLLATTDPHKIPVTVLSRCLQFNLKRLLPTQIAAQMQFILGEEKIAYEEAAIRVIARSADGSLRDGLSLLDQAIAFGSGAVGFDDVNNMLGTVAQQPVEEILQTLAAKDAKACLERIAELAALTPDFGELLEQMLRILHRVAILQQVPELVDHEFDKLMMVQLAEQLTPEDVQLFYQIALLGQKDLDLAPDPRTGFEMVMLRMLAFQPNRNSTVKATGPMPASGLKRQPVKQRIDEDKSKQTKVRVETDAVSDQPFTNESPVQSNLNWTEIIQAMKIRGLSRELANNCILERMDEKHCYLIIDPSQENLLGGKSEQKLQKALQEYFGKPLKLQITRQKTDTVTPAAQYQQAREDRQQAAVDAIHADTNVKALQEQFGARILSGTIEPIDE